MTTTRTKKVLFLAAAWALAIAPFAIADYREDIAGGNTISKASVVDGSSVHRPIVVVDPVPATGVTYLHSSSGNVANASAVATLAGAASVTTYICGFQVTAGGATAAALVTGTLAGLIGGTLSFTYAAPAGVAVGGLPYVVQFDPCLSASAVNTSLVLTLPALGAGNTNATVSAWGLRK